MNVEKVTKVRATVVSWGEKGCKRASVQWAVVNFPRVVQNKNCYAKFCFFGESLHVVSPGRTHNKART